MKSYTDINQSKKLAEILPIESADMCLNISQFRRTSPLMTPYSKFDEFFNVSKTPEYLIPCWSLAALLNYIKDKCGYFHVYISSTFDGRANKLENVNRLSTDIYDVYENELIDACYEMILKLYKQKLL